MSTLLQINTGIFAENSHSTVLANQFTANYLSQNPATELVVRDLISEPIPHLDASIIGAFASEEAARTPEQQAIPQFFGEDLGSDLFLGLVRPQKHLNQLILRVFNKKSLPSAIFPFKGVEHF